MHLGGENFDYLVVGFCMHDFILEAKATAGDTHPVGEDFVYLAVDFRTRIQSFTLVVKATAGDMHLDDEDIVFMIVDFCMQAFIILSARILSP